MDEWSIGESLRERKGFLCVSEKNILAPAESARYKLAMDFQAMIRKLGTEQEAADQLGVARSTVWRLLRGAQPSYKTVQKLLELQKRELRKRGRAA